MELDLFAGYAIPLGDSGATLDLGLTWYMYPSGADKTDFEQIHNRGLIGVNYGVVQLWVHPHQSGVEYVHKQE